MRYKIIYMDGDFDEYWADNKTHYVTVDIQTGLVLISYHEDPSKGCPQITRYIPPNNIRSIEVIH